MLQSKLRKLFDEASYSNSLVYTCIKNQRDELKILLKSSTSDLRELDKVLAEYNSLKTANPRYEIDLELALTNK